MTQCQLLPHTPGVYPDAAWLCAMSANGKLGYTYMLCYIHMLCYASKQTLLVILQAVCSCKGINLLMVPELFQLLTHMLSLPHPLVTQPNP